MADDALCQKLEPRLGEYPLGRIEARRPAGAIPDSLKQACVRHS
jgi:hypothetical protein